MKLTFDQWCTAFALAVIVMGILFILKYLELT
jgi:hypothetical protein